MLDSITINFRQDPNLSPAASLHVTRTDELDGQPRIIVRGGEGVLHEDRVATFHGLVDGLGPRPKRVSAEDLLGTEPGALVAFDGWLPVVTTHDEPSARFTVYRQVESIDRREAVTRSDAKAVAR